MTTRLSGAEAEAAYGRAMSLAKRARSVAAKADEYIDTGVTALVTSAAAFGAGVVQGRYGGVEFVGVPADLGAGLALHGLGLAGVGGKNARLLHAAGNGALAGYFASLGRGVGGEWRDKALTGGGATAQLPPAAPATKMPGHTVSPETLQRMADGGV